MKEKSTTPVRSASADQVHQSLRNLLVRQKNACDWLGLRAYREQSTFLGVKNEKFDHQREQVENGVMVEVICDGHFGYAATQDLSDAGLDRAFTQALALARSFASRALHRFSFSEVRPKAQGSYRSPGKITMDQLGFAEASERLTKASLAMKVSDEVIHRMARLILVETSIQLVSSSGTEVDQEFKMLMTDFNAAAKRGSEVQVRSDQGGLARCYQSGMEDLQLDNILPRCYKVGVEAVSLLSAEDCPSGKFDVILAPDQMMLQIHESIGHPLELDRILGDERNFAGWSFVGLEDFGVLQYGSPLMNVTYDPTQHQELASFSFDDGGQRATSEFLIKEGKLVRGLGGLESQARSHKPGVANFRSASWNRAPIDRMGNINLLPGSSSLPEMVKSIERGVMMYSNKSWSIDDYRRKFQFSCEYGEFIENGKVTKVVKNPNYRGETLGFWRSLAAVGDKIETYGSPYCGKGEPSQIIRVGHSAPHCLFRNLEVFGGGK